MAVRSLLVASFAVCLLLVCGIAGAGARESRRGDCSLEAGPASASIAAGESATITGTLSCAEAAEAEGQTVAVFQHTRGTRGAQEIGTATTTAGGAFTFTTEVLSDSSSFSVRAMGARSRRTSVKVTASITLEGPADEVVHLSGRRGAGAALTFTGTVGAADDDARVVLQRESRTAEGDWRRIGTAAVGADGTYSIAHSFAMPGTVTVRTVVRRRGQRAAASEPLTYVVAQRQNPALTIEPSQDPLDAGDSLEISGAVQGADEAPVVLLARTGHGALAPVAEGSTDAAGSYAFPGLMPLESTRYIVTSGSARSTVLYEAVRPTLTASASAATSAAGETVTFSGALAPGDEGALVLLQRAEASGLAFQTVASQATGPDGEYSFSQALLGTGHEVFRVKVPRHGGLAAVASPTMAVDVTAAPPAPSGG